jgi:hypothetical protein
MLHDDERRLLLIFSSSQNVYVNVTFLNVYVNVT